MRRAKARILLVDDDHALRGALALGLSEEGYDVVEEGDAAKAKAWLARHVPSLLLVDIMMPDLNGLEFCRWLKRQARLRTLPVLVMSAIKDEETVQDALELGVTGFLRKPFTLKELLEKSAAALAPGDRSV